ncbi:MAG: nuclear transport factor 2 family protein [Komarekiella atlantica HA4396-MV6]|jgi:ketosteroid isomerase-like protein|nr:nuclear transport factor 2 family protein [Komarekiella atlantica HA4396-MV6]
MNKAICVARSCFAINILWFGVTLLIIGLPTLVRAQKVAGNEVIQVRTQKVVGNEAQNKKLIQQTFEQWAKGNGNFFDLLTDNVQWTIAGSSPLSKTYIGKQQFINQTVTPLTSRLATPIVPKIREVYADGDVVIALWNGIATAKDGKPYRNTYCWVMTLKNGRITHVVAFLDLMEYMNVLKRIPAGN